jgi:hypothetical protein
MFLPTAPGYDFNMSKAILVISGASTLIQGMISVTELEFLILSCIALQNKGHSFLKASG